MDVLWKKDWEHQVQVGDRRMKMNKREDEIGEIDEEEIFDEIDVIDTRFLMMGKSFGLEHNEDVQKMNFEMVKSLME